MGHERTALQTSGGGEGLAQAYLRPTVALRSQALLALASLGGAVCCSLLSFDRGSDNLTSLGVVSVVMLGGCGVAILLRRKWQFFLLSGALTLLLTMSFHRTEGLGLGGLWAILLLCLFGMFLGGMVMDVRGALDQRSEGWPDGDPVVARTLWRECARLMALLGASFLMASVLLTIAGMLALGDLSLLLLAMLSILTLVSFYAIASSDPRSER